MVRRTIIRYGFTFFFLSFFLDLGRRADKGLVRTVASLESGEKKDVEKIRTQERLNDAHRMVLREQEREFGEAK